MLLFDTQLSPFLALADQIGYMENAMHFTIQMYLGTIVPFLGILIYTRITKRNRFIFHSFMPRAAGNNMRALLMGLLVGFVMNFGCIVCALAAGNIKLFLSFTANQIPLFLFALVCVFIQSTSEELWCRGFMYERINVHYPLWVAILVNGLFFAALHLGNPGAGVLPIADIAVCGLAFSVAKWYTKSIWFPMGIHTAWNFTQNFLFGLPNSGLVSEASVFTLDAASAKSNLIYDAAFGVEGAIPAVAADAILGIICLALAAKNGRLRELGMKHEQLVEAGVA
jgi:membrane protease YdiL (CAAX protease family)